MTLVHRVLNPRAISSLDDYIARYGGERGLRRARDLSPEQLIDRLAASGLRGRGGAGFPTGAKWSTVRENASPVAPTTVVVNGAEGEPGTFKDRTILRCNPYHVLEGALIAAHDTAFSLLRSLADAVIVAEADGMITEWNTGSEALLGWTAPKQSVRRSTSSSRND